MMLFQSLFPHAKPVIAMLHLKSSPEQSMLDRAKQEIDIYLESGVEAVLAENYFGSALDCEAVLKYLQEQRFPLVYGVNILDSYPRAFEMCRDYGAQLLQIDSVCGHLPPEKDEFFGDHLMALKKNCSAAVLGGVRFKYQPVRSGRSLGEDLKLGAQRCDAVVVTGEGTGMATPMEKVKAFRAELKDFPLIIGAGVTPAALKDSLALADGLIVGSWFKEGHIDFGEVCPRYVREFMEQKRTYAS